MEMTLRWYGSKFDTVTLKQIRQIPGVKGVITTLYGKMPGELWTVEEIRQLRNEVEVMRNENLSTKNKNSSLISFIS